ncbi:Fe-S cluster assembly protein SufB [Leptolyngbya sp. FACHB-261]|uniref:Fe-S cluster assembly protein SufB n=1 Tax=Leptolyngbya sp. FACHB-261 TaxID=2692806 RepID=UPI001684E1FF|nr:Fe-S cluster assembly protein SufB [Leptolyngbya sp. FACHB-261]MBD2101856.1 Fe-S cluster assembly protein SufB [Leptolyngbya sp. FACHB-261]
MVSTPSKRPDLQFERQANYETEFGFHDEENYLFKTPKGLNEEVVRAISARKQEPEWMLEFRLKSYRLFADMPMLNWGGELSGLDFDEIYYYMQPSTKEARSWEDVPDSVRRTFDRLGIPEAERASLAGVGAQYDSEMVYHNLQQDLVDQGIIFKGMDAGLREHEDIVRKYIGSIIPPSDNKFAALNSAVWSGGSFIYVPKGVHVDIPLQTYFRINADKAGQFERTLIIADEGAYVHYIEGCTAPVYAADALHSAVVELVALPGARIRYSTVQNWSKNVYNLVTKRAYAYENATVEWIDGNMGSKLTMKYPAVWLMGEGAHGEVLSLAYASEDQHQDTGAKMVHVAPNTTSRIVSKSISRGSQSRTSYRGLVKVTPEATNARSTVQCDALLLDSESRSDTYPYMEIDNVTANIGHEASVSKISEEKLFYLTSRGLTEEEAMRMVVAGFIEPITRELPMEYAVEMNRLIELEMEGSIG